MGAVREEIDSAASDIARALGGPLLPLANDQFFLDSLPPSEVVAGRRKLVQEGRPCEDLFVVHSGWLAAFRQLPDGGRQIFNFWLPGEAAGIEFFACKVAPFSVTTLTPCRVTRLSRDRLQAWTQASPHAAALLFGLVCRNNVILRERMVGLGRRSAFCRVAHLLLELAMRRNNGAIPKNGGTPLPLTQLEVADTTGLTAPYVNRIFRSMRERGFLTISKDGLEIRDFDKLMRLVGFRPHYLQLLVEAPADDDDRAPAAPLPAPAAIA